MDCYYYGLSEELQKEMNPKAKQGARALIKAECCNFMDGNCLPTDAPCEQYGCDSLVCGWFDEAVLPLNEVLQAQIHDEKSIKKCQKCGLPFRSVANAAKYCESCSRQVAKSQKRVWASEKRSKPTPV